MTYEIPQQIAYEERIIFGLTFRQLIYVLIFSSVATFSPIRIEATTLARWEDKNFKDF